MNLIWLRRAIANREAQLNYIGQDSLRAAIEQGDRITQQVNQLRQHPEMGRPGRIKGTRELVIGRTPFIVVYRLKVQRIEIIRLLHGSQQWLE